MTDDERTAKLEALYARIPKMKDCKGKCEDSCTVIPVSVFEKTRLEAAMGRAFEPVGALPGRIRCSALTEDGRCSQYELRPSICRAFGAVDHPFMKCDHGCEPERWIGGDEFFEIMMAIQELCGKTETPHVEGWPRMNKAQAEEASRLFK